MPEVALDKNYAPEEHTGNRVRVHNKHKTENLVLDKGAILATTMCYLLSVWHISKDLPNS